MRGFPGCFFACSIALVGITRAQSIKESLPPASWLNQVTPEALPPLEYPAYTKGHPLDRARLEHAHGRDRLALFTLSQVTDPKDADAARLLRGQVLTSLGRFAEVVSLLQSDPSPAAQLVCAHALAAVGKTDDAMTLLRAHLKQHPDSIGGHFAMGQLHEQLGDIASATADYAWFVEGANSLFTRWQNEQEKAFDNADDLITVGRAVDRWASVTAAYEKSPGLNDALLDLFVKAYDVVDRQNAAAHVAAASFQADHDNAFAADTELKAALQINPTDIDAMVLLGKLAAKAYDFDKCDAAVEHIQSVDPDSIAAKLLATRNLLAQRSPREAMRPLQLVIDEQPKNLEAMGLLASVKSLELQDDQCASILGQVDSIAPHDATAYLEVADQLAAMRQYPRSAAMYKIAVERAPWWTNARNGLGLLYTQSGDEDDARAALEAAHQLDPYNLRTTNYLRLLDQMDGFAKVESPHFVVSYDATADPVIPEYFCDYLETAYKAVTSDFQFEPSKKTFIEVFPTHDAFSVRTTGSPWIGTVGASTGRVIALVSPRKGAMTLGTFNWTQVLRHEFTHTVTLGATDNRIPHWFTEGLAVWEEHEPLRWEWIPMLYQAVMNDGLFTMDNLTWGFIRPRRPIDRQLAYAQSFWICTYIEQKYGHEAILKMLAGYKDGLPQEQVFPNVIHLSQDNFFDEFRAWAKQQVATWGYDPDSTKRYTALREQGEQLIEQKRYPEAVAVWEQILKLRPVDELPHQRLAGLYLTKACRDLTKAVWNLSALDAVELKDDRFAKRIAQLDESDANLSGAITEAQRAVYTDPYDLSAHQLLASILEKDGNEPDALAKEQKVIPILQQWIEDAKNREEN